MHLKDLLEPSGVATLLFLAGAAAALVHRSRPWSSHMLAASAAVCSVFSKGLAAGLLLGPLEDSYPVLRSRRATLKPQSL